MGDTKNDLVKDLQEKPPSPERDEIVLKAQAGEYHDFDSPHVAPKIQCAQDLKDADFMDLVAKVVEGAYDDEQPSVEQEEEMRASLGPKVFDAVMGKPSRPEN